MNSITCPCCGGQRATQINHQEYRCEYCGHTFAPIAPRRSYSSQSSYRQSSYQTQSNFLSGFESRTASGKNRLTAALLAILLGWIGAHHFYLGNTGLGILYLLFCWTGITAIIGLIEGIIYLTQSDEEFASKH